MTDSAPNESTARSVRRLTTAVWIIAILVAVNLVVSCLALFSPAFLARRITDKRVLSSRLVQDDEYNNFHEWPLERQIQTASVIAIGKWQKSDSTLKCIISEILKQAPNTEFYYKVGDEFRSSSQHVSDNTNYGDGRIMFFTGSPAMFRYSTTYEGNRILGMGDMPISELRELVRKSNP